MYRDTQQQALGFLVSQVSVIEATVNRILYPDIQYPMLVPVDTSANQWAKSVTYFSIDKIGQAEWFSAQAKDVPIADVMREKFEHGIEMAAIGYRYTTEEIGQALMVPGTNLTTERAEAARRAADEKLDAVALRGDVGKGWYGLLNAPAVTVATARANGNNNSTYFIDKSGDQMAADMNDALTGVYTESNTIEMANTILLPVSTLNLMATTRMTNIEQSALAWFKANNIYTMVTGQPIDIRAVRGLETAGEDGGGRMVVYRKDPQVVKFHLPMPHQFLPVWQTGPMVFDIPGVFRTGGTEIRRPGAVRYVDGIVEAPGT
jgi:hypothetical protein